MQRFGREAADGCEPRFRAMLADHFEAVQLPPDELAASMGAELARTNCTVHALRRRADAGGVSRGVAGAGAEGAEGGGGGEGGGKRRRLARVM